MRRPWADLQGKEAVGELVAAMEEAGVVGARVGVESAAAEREAEVLAVVLEVG